MRVKDGNIDDLYSETRNKKLVCYGAGWYLRYLCKVFASRKFAERINFVADKNADKLGGEFRYENTVKPLGTLETFLRKNPGDDFVIAISITDYYDVFLELQKRDELCDISVYICVFVEIQPPVYSLPERAPQEKPVIPKKIHYCWFGGKPIPEQLRVYMESWRKFCPDYEIIRWDESNYDVTKNRYMTDAYQAEMWAFVPDYARLDIVYEHGGIYLDTDVELIKPLDYFLGDGAFFGLQSLGVVAVGLGFGAMPKHEIIKRLRDHYNSLSFHKKTSEGNYIASPEYITTALKALGFDESLIGIQKVGGAVIYPPDVFAPIDVSTLTKHITPNTHAMHHFAAAWVNESQKSKIQTRAKQARAVLEFMRRDA